MQTPFISYYEHLAKLAQIANKQTLFLARILYLMEFSKEHRQYFVDMSQFRKLEIMKEISPLVEDKNALTLANQYLNKLKKAGFIRSIGKGVWIVDPMSYGKYRSVSKSLRTENATMFLTSEYSPAGLRETSTSIVDDRTGKSETAQDYSKAS